MVISPQAALKSGSFRSCSLLGQEAGAASADWLFLESRRALSAGSAVFEGPPVPLISRGTPRCERAPSPGPPHCSVLFLYPRSPHSMKLRGTSSISPVPHVNRRFNQTLLLGLPLCSPSNMLTGRKKRKKTKNCQILHCFIFTVLFLFIYFFNHISSSVTFFFSFFPPLSLSTSAFLNCVACVCFLCGRMHFVSSCGVFPHWLITHT